MTALIPHFDLPFTFDTTTGCAVVVEQDSDADVMNCVSAAVRTTRGTRLYVPTFGIDDPTFSEIPIDEVAMESQIADSEPRADASVSQQISELVDNIKVTVGVGSIGS